MTLSSIFQTLSERSIETGRKRPRSFARPKRRYKNFSNMVRGNGGQYRIVRTGILQRTVEFKPDLIVVGALGLSSNGVSGIGSVSQKILSEGHSQVRIVRSNPKTDPAHLKIVICFYGSPCSMEAVKTVAQRSWPRQLRSKTNGGHRSTGRVQYPDEFFGLFRTYRKAN